jgi:hypothetical protein
MLLGADGICFVDRHAADGIDVSHWAGPSVP